MDYDITQLLLNWNKGDEGASEKLFSAVYKELHHLAVSRLQKERSDHSFQASDLINEAYIRLIDCQKINWQSRVQFFSVAAQIMRNILIDHGRKHGASKRGGNKYKLSLSELNKLADQIDVDLIALDDALNSLALLDSQQSRIVELRYFAGLSIEEVAEVLSLSPATVSREWRLAKIWLLHELDNSQK